MTAIDVEMIGIDQIIEIAVNGDQDVDVDAEISVIGGGTDYNDLAHKPKIEGVELEGDKTLEDIGLTSPTNAEIAALFG